MGYECSNGRVVRSWGRATWRACWWVEGVGAAEGLVVKG